jgi:RimJ/RimL family protein N-acetyltransferase
MQETPSRFKEVEASLVIEPGFSMSGWRVSIRPWSDRDQSLLERILGDPEMTRHLGGPRSSEEIAKRHERYLGIVRVDSSKARTFAVVSALNQEAVGWVGYWEIERQGRLAYETGWSILPAHQGCGFATQASLLALKSANQEKCHREVYAFPNVSNPASNAICRKLGFTLVEECDIEHPPGHWMRANCWKLELPFARS